jgi:hypothetical protein
VIFSPPRAGSHMLRSMLRADGRVYDAGECLIDAGPGYAARGAELAWVLRQAQKAAPPGAIIVSNPKVHPRHAFDDIAQAVRGFTDRALLLTRDPLEIAASRALAGAIHVWKGRSAVVPDIVLTRKDAVRAMEMSLAVEQMRLALREAGVDVHEIGYAAAQRREAVRGLVAAVTGVALEVGEPTTPRATDGISTYVSNIKDRTLWHGLPAEPDGDRLPDRRRSLA